MAERNVEALTELRRVVEAAPDDLWDMYTFTSTTRCGTAHCAAGWFAVDPWARENTEIGFCFDSKGHACGLAGFFVSIKLGEIFGLVQDNTMALFFPESCEMAVSKSAVIANINRLLAGQDAIPYAELVTA